MLNIIKGKQRRAQRVILYGQEGVGKSTLAAQFPKPLFLDTEQGSCHLNVDRVAVDCMGNIETAVSEVISMKRHGNCPYKTLVIDTADALWRMAADLVCAENNWKNIEAPSYGKGYAVASARFISFFRKLDVLKDLGMHVVIVCHAKVININLPDASEYIKYGIKVSAPSKQAETAREFLKEWCDVLIYCAIKTNVDELNKKAISAEEHVIYCCSNAHCESKNRVGLEPEMPMTVDSIKRIWEGDDEEPEQEEPVPMPVQEEQEACEGGPSFSKEDYETLVNYFVSLGKLSKGQPLTDLPKQLYAALMSRPEAALNAAKKHAGKE